MSAIATERSVIGFEVEDVTGQRVHEVNDVPIGTTVGDLVRSVLDHLNLPDNDGNGTIAYSAVLPREGRMLSSSERIGDAIHEGDRVVLQREINAG